MSERRTIIAAMNPVRMVNDYRVTLKVWFAELDEPVAFLADPMDCEVHGRELWIRAMAGEYGPVEIVAAEQLPASIRAFGP